MILKVLTLCILSLSVKLAVSQPWGNSRENGQSNLPKEIYHPMLDYKFGYEITDPHELNYQNRYEVSTGGKLRGSHSHLAPDGVVRTTVYSDDGYGFQAVLHEVPSYIDSYNIESHEEGYRNPVILNSQKQFAKFDSNLSVDNFSEESSDSSEEDRFVRPKPRYSKKFRRYKHPNARRRFKNTFSHGRNFGRTLYRGNKAGSLPKGPKSIVDTQDVSLENQFFNVFGMSKKHNTNEDLTRAIQRTLFRINRTQKGRLDNNPRSSEDVDDSSVKLRSYLSPKSSSEEAGSEEQQKSSTEDNNENKGRTYDENSRENNIIDKNKDKESNNWEGNETGKNLKNVKTADDAKSSLKSLDEDTEFVTKPQDNLKTAQDSDNLISNTDDSTKKKLRQSEITSKQTTKPPENKKKADGLGILLKDDLAFNEITTQSTNLVPTVLSTSGIPVIGIDKSLFDSLSLPDSLYTRDDLVREIQTAFQDAIKPTTPQTIVEQNPETEIDELVTIINNNDDELDINDLIEKKTTLQVIVSEDEDRNPSKTMGLGKELKLTNNEQETLNKEIDDTEFLTDSGFIPIIALDKPIFDSLSTPGSSLTQNDLIQAIQSSLRAVLNDTGSDDQENGRSVQKGLGDLVPIEMENEQITAGLGEEIISPENLNNIELEEGRTSPLALNNNEEISSIFTEQLNNKEVESEVDGTVHASILNAKESALPTQATQLTIDNESKTENNQLPTNTVNLKAINQTLFQSILSTDEPEDVNELLSILQGAISSISQKQSSNKAILKRNIPQSFTRKVLEKVEDVDVHPSLVKKVDNSVPLFGSHSMRKLSILPAKFNGGFKSFTNNRSEFRHMLNKMIGPVIDI